MSNPRAGGEADKFGNRYEGIWTVIHLLEVLAGQANSIAVEPANPEHSDGAEFILDLPGATQAHQVKRQRSGVATWTLRALVNEGVVEAARKHTKQGREFHFVSMTPAFQLSTLADKARRSDSFAALRNHMLTNEQQAWLASLMPILGTEDDALALLRGTIVRVADKALLQKIAASTCQQLFAGASDARQIPPILGDFITTHLGRTMRSGFIRSELERSFGIRARDSAGVREVRSELAAITDRWKRGLDRELLIPPITRTEVGTLRQQIECQDSDRVLLVTGDAGSGKSEVLRQFVAQLDDEAVPVLALRLDRLETTQINNAAALGVAIGIDGSPVSVLAAAAESGRAVLIVDQLDAVSLIAGRASAAFDAVADLIEEASSRPNLTVVCSCRGFDLKNDHRIRRLFDHRQSQPIDVGQLSTHQLNEALVGIGANPDTLNHAQLGLLRTPLNLRLFAELVGGGMTDNAFDTRKSLFDLYWDFQRRVSGAQGVTSEAFTAILTSLALRMSNEQRLSLPLSSVPDPYRSDGDKLASLHVIVLREGRWAFFHESFFDYTFARQWVQQDRRVVDFLLSGEQELFRRSQVRQILWALQDDDEDRFLTEIYSILTNPSIRYHIKELSLAVLGSLRSPTRTAWRTVDSLLGEAMPSREAILRSIRTVEWVRRLADEGVFESWLRSDDQDLEVAAINLIDTAARQDPALAARIIELSKDHPRYPQWLSWLLTGSSLHVSKSWFSLIKEGVAAGFIGPDHSMLWYAASGLPEKEPDWAIELMDAVLNRRPDAFVKDDGGRIPLLRSNESYLLQFVQAISKTAPQNFSWLALRYINRASQATAYPDIAGRPREDRHFSHVLFNNEVPDLDDIVLTEAANAALASAAVDEVQRITLIDYLASSLNYSSQFILYQLLAEHPIELAERAAAILLEGERRWFSGYSDSPFWLARELLRLITPFVSDPIYEALERAIMSFRPNGENVPEGVGHSSFTLLTGLDVPRRSGDVQAVIAEGQIRFGGESHLQPRGIVVGIVSSPVSVAEGTSYNDADWIRVIEETGESSGDRPNFVGGSHELSQVVGRFVSQEPSRFIAILSAVSGDVSPMYFGAALRALGDGSVPVDAGELFAFVHYCASKEISEIDRWLCAALRNHLKSVPDDLVSKIAERAVSSADPMDDSQMLAHLRQGGARPQDDIRFYGMNSARGSLTEGLADLLSADEDGRRSAIIQPQVLALASDKTMQVRSCASRLVAATISHDLDAAKEAFERLIDFPDERLLASGSIDRLLVYLGYQDVGPCVPVIERMVQSGYSSVARSGGSLAAFFGLELGQLDLLARARASESPLARAGVAHVCAQRLSSTSSRQEAEESLRVLMSDADTDVRAAVAEVAAALRDTDLADTRSILVDLIDSPSLEQAIAQLLITLDRATVQVDDLVLRLATRFTTMNGRAVSDISTGAAADAFHVAELVVRAYAQAEQVSQRSLALDLIDDSLRLGVMNMRDLLLQSER